VIVGMHKVNDALRSMSENVLPGKVSDKYKIQILYISVLRI